MGLAKWFARRGNVGGTARAVAKGWLTIKKQNPEMNAHEIADAYLDIRYGIRGESELAEKVLYKYGVCPLELAWAILKAENEDELTTLYDHQEAWKEIMREEIEKFKLDPYETW